MQFDNKVILVSGAASGLGAATARHAYELGAHVILTDCNQQQGEAQLAAMLALKGRAGQRAVFWPLDVTNGPQAEALFNEIKASFGGLDILVNCAGVAPGARLIGKEGLHDLAAFERCISINLTGSFNLTRLAAGLMMQQEPGPDGERGVIIMTASVAAFEGQIGQAAYAASKAGVAGMVLPIARELARYGIRCVGIAPGIFQTPMMAGMRAEVQEGLCQNVPFPPRFGRPLEYAALVQHIVENMMLNGAVIRLDGGLRMPAR